MVSNTQKEERRQAKDMTRIISASLEVQHRARQSASMSGLEGEAHLRYTALFCMWVTSGRNVARARACRQAMGRLTRMYAGLPF